MVIATAEYFKHVVSFSLRLTIALLVWVRSHKSQVMADSYATPRRQSGDWSTKPRSPFILFHTDYLAEEGWTNIVALPLFLSQFLTYQQ